MERSDGPRYYTLDASGAVEPCRTLEMWMIWFGLTPFEQRLIAYDAPGDITVSTVFMGIDTAGYGTPALWETRIFSAGISQITRYTSRAAAAAGHARIVRDILGAQHSQAN